MTKTLSYMLIIRGGPLDILGGGVSDPKKKFMQGIELEKKIPASAWRRKKIRATSWID